MAVSYNKLWKLLIDKNMNKTELKEAAGISFNVMARMGKNETISFDSIEKICAVMDCNIGDIIEVVQETSEKPTKEKLSAIELFAGAGGLALGIEEAGFDTIGLIEFDKAASDTLKCNRPNWRVINDDIANISCLDLEEYFNIKKGELDLLSGGAPCQAFSYAGKRLGLEDARGMELIEIYGELLSKMREDKLIRSKNVTGDLGEYIVVDYYTKTKGLPKLQFAPPSTKNIDAISVNGERYSIKCITTNTTGAFYGIEKDTDINAIKPLFEYVVIIKLNEKYQPEFILELDWEAFFKHKHWHSRIGAYNLLVTNSLIEDGKMIYKKN